MTVFAMDYIAIFLACQSPKVAEHWNKLSVLGMQICSGSCTDVRAECS